MPPHFGQKSMAFFFLLECQSDKLGEPDLDPAQVGEAEERGAEEAVLGDGRLVKDGVVVSFCREHALVTFVGYVHHPMDDGRVAGTASVHYNVSLFNAFD